MQIVDPNQTNKKRARIRELEEVLRSYNQTDLEKTYRLARLYGAGELDLDSLDGRRAYEEAIREDADGV